MKYFIVSGCDHCPHLYMTDMIISPSEGAGWKCSLAGDRLICEKASEYTARNSIEIPAWCPMPDVKKEGKVELKEQPCQHHDGRPDNMPTIAIKGRLTGEMRDMAEREFECWKMMGGFEKLKRFLYFDDACHSAFSSGYVSGYNRGWDDKKKESAHTDPAASE